MQRSAMLRLPMVLAVLALACLMVTPALAQPFPAGPADETTPSLGKAIISVNGPFQGLVNTLPGWGLPTAGHWTTPLMYDPATVIGRSNPLTDGSGADIGGVPVGTAGTIVADGNFTVVPTMNFTEGPVGTNEIHTEIFKMNMQDLCTGAFQIRGGTGAGVAFPSFGEVEALPGSNDFPAESFFNVFIELDTPFYGGTTLYNIAPLLVVNPGLTGLPPNVVYIHEETPAVAILFKNGPKTGQIFGYLRLAGHSVGGECQDPCNISRCPAAQALDDALESTEMMKCRKCNVVAVPHEPIPHEPVPTQH